MGQYLMCSYVMFLRVKMKNQQLRNFNSTKYLFHEFNGRIYLSVNISANYSFIRPTFPRAVITTTKCLNNLIQQKTFYRPQLRLFKKNSCFNRFMCQHCLILEVKDYKRIDHKHFNSTEKFNGSHIIVGRKYIK